MPHEQSIIITKASVSCIIGFLVVFIAGCDFNKNPMEDWTIAHEWQMHRAKGESARSYLERLIGAHGLSKDLSSTSAISARWNFTFYENGTWESLFALRGETGVGL